MQIGNMSDFDKIVRIHFLFNSKSAIWVGMNFQKNLVFRVQKSSKFFNIKNNGFLNDNQN